MCRAAKSFRQDRHRICPRGEPQRPIRDRNTFPPPRRRVPEGVPPCQARHPPPGTWLAKTPRCPCRWVLGWRPSSPSSAPWSGWRSPWPSSGGGFTWVDLGLLVGMYLLTALGITVGYHRLFVHRSFETNIVVKFVLAVLGSMAVQGSLLKWVALHRRHHQHSDKMDDPHTPHHQGRGILGWLRGYWRAHIGWFFEPEPAELSRYVPDLERSRALRVASVLFPLWITRGLLSPAVLGGLLSGTRVGVWTGFIWGGLVRIFLVHHVTWSVNSACYLWGLRPYRSGDESRNNAVFGVLALGEGWHNTHHAFPTSARHGLRSLVSTQRLSPQLLGGTGLAAVVPICIGVGRTCRSEAVPVPNPLFPRACGSDTPW